SLLKKKMQLLRWNNPGQDTRRASSMVRGAGCREINPRLRRREKNVLDIPFYRSDDSAQNPCPSIATPKCIGQAVSVVPNAAALEAVAMGKQRIKPNYRRRLLRLPDLDHCTRSVLNSLGSPGSRRVYEYAIDQLLAWYCSEPRLAFNRIVVVRYRMHLESRRLAANTINQQ